MIRSVLAFLGILFAPLLVWAQAEVEFPNTLPVFGGAQIVTEEKLITSNYILALGPYERSGNIWQSEEQLRLKGALVRQTHEIPRNNSERDVYDYYTSLLTEGSELLYECEGFNCGASNNWANAHFGIKQLYGLDRHQFYRVVLLNSGEYVTLYVVRRGNRRIFAQVEIIKPEL